MGQQILLQPNGLFAIFSSGTDTFIGYDMTEEEILEKRVAEAAQRQHRDTLNALKAARETGSSAYKPFAESFESAYEIHIQHNGKPFAIRKRFEPVVTEEWREEPGILDALDGKDSNG